METPFFTANSARVWPEQIITSWRRFSSGLWRVPEGDISQAYCADILPKLKVFSHNGQLFTNTGGFSRSPVTTEATSYPLIALADYAGSAPRKYSYEGREGRYGGKTFILGAKVLFQADDPTVQEWQSLFRSLYADGGCFASQERYVVFLAEIPELWLTENSEPALALERAGELVSCQKAELRAFLNCVHQTLEVRRDSSR